MDVRSSGGMAKWQRSFLFPSLEKRDKYWSRDSFIEHVTRFFMGVIDNCTGTILMVTEETDLDDGILSKIKAATRRRVVIRQSFSTDSLWNSITCSPSSSLLRKWTRKIAITRTEWNLISGVCSHCYSMSTHKTYVNNTFRASPTTTYVISVCIRFFTGA